MTYHKTINREDLALKVKDCFLIRLSSATLKIEPINKKLMMHLLLENMATFKRTNWNYLIMIQILKSIHPRDLRIYFNLTNKKIKKIIKNCFSIAKGFKKYKKKILMIQNKPNKALLVTFKQSKIINKLV